MDNHTIYAAPTSANLGWRAVKLYSQRLVIGLLGLILTSTLITSAPVPATPAGLCWRWQNTCTASRVIFGVRICYAWKLTCI
jgi:hypothetical protein